jgi:hypothetical protein
LIFLGNLSVTNLIGVQNGVRNVAIGNNGNNSNSSSTSKYRSRKYNNYDYDEINDDHIDEGNEENSFENLPSHAIML